MGFIFGAIERDHRVPRPNGPKAWGSRIHQANLSARFVYTLRYILALFPTSAKEAIQKPPHEFVAISKSRVYDIYTADNSSWYPEVGSWDVFNDSQQFE